MIFILCGVAGCGKTTIGKLLANSLGVSFYDADDFHPQSNLAKMTIGLALNDEDREPWLRDLAKRLQIWQKEGGAVLACSALKESYRETLSSCFDGNIQWIIFSVPEAALRDRLESRKGHFVDQRLLESQLQDFELPHYGLNIEATFPPEHIVEHILSSLHDS